MGQLCCVEQGERVILMYKCITLLEICIHHRQGSWKTGEKEVGTSEESKKLEENNHAV